MFLRFLERQTEDFHVSCNLVARAMPVRGRGRHWLWGNKQPEPLNLGVPVVCWHTRLIDVKPITAQEKFYFPTANAFQARAQVLLRVRDCVSCISKHFKPHKFLFYSRHIVLNSYNG